MMAHTYPERIRGNTVRAWEDHRSVPPVNMNNIRSYVMTMVVITYIPRKSKGQYHTNMETIPHEHGQVTGQYRL